MRARILGVLALWSLSTFALAADDPTEPARERPRSVLFYLVDTCRDDRMTFRGYDRETTPFLAWLAQRSVVFEACYSQAPWTKPSMASLLTSRYPGELGVQEMLHRLPQSAETWPEVLQANGMYTAGFSANIVMGNLLSGMAQGFDHFVESTHINRGDPIRFASGSAAKLNEHAFAWLDETDHWPMLLYLHSVDPHEEYEPAAQYLERFADPGRHEQFREEWQKLLKSRPPIPGLYVTQEDFDRTQLDSASFIEHASNLYDADILANDEELRRLWDKLQADGWGEDFILVIASDHGEEFFDHGGTSHGYSLYDEMIRVPLLIHAPGLLPAGKRIDTPVRNLDLFPTLLDLLDIEAPPGLRGRSLVPLVRDEPTAEVTIFAEHRGDRGLRKVGLGSGILYGARRGKWKLIYNRVSPQRIARPELELFDLEADPRETNNLAAVEEEVVADLSAELQAFVNVHGAAQGSGETTDLDGVVLDQLRKLGYVGEDAGGSDIWSVMEGEDLVPLRKALAEGADPEALHPTLGTSPLTSAVWNGDRGRVDILLGAGAAVNRRNGDGSTALHAASFRGRTALVELLLGKGADVNARDGKGATPLHAAAFAGEVEAVRLLLAKGADRDLVDGTGVTPRGATAIDWPTTQFVYMLLGLPKPDREQVEANRAAVAKLLDAAGSGGD